jgi:NADH-quinone oxidoreductase subunit M
MLSLLIFLPILIALALLFIPVSNKNIFRIATLITTLIQLVLSILIYINYKNGEGNFRLVEKTSWIHFEMGSWGAFSAEYWVGLDGMSLPLVLMSSVVFVIAALSSWSINKSPKGYFILFLILNTSVLGSFAAMDALLFFVFFEFMLIPMYFLIGIWGSENREYASIKFFLYTLLGSIFILIAIIALYSSVQLPGTNAQHTFGLSHLANGENFIAGSFLDPNSAATFGSWSWRAWIFLLLFIGFAIKLPAVPFHTWLPDAHVEAPTPVSILLAALLLKVGGYGMIRLGFYIFPNEAASFSLLTGSLALISIIYGALNAMASKDLKRMIAYSSISHMGFVLLGVASGTTEGVAGSVYQMVSHGLIASMLFAIAGVLYDRTSDRIIANYSGLFSVAPQYTAFVLLAFFAAMGMPGFSGFIGEIMVFLGSFASHQQNGFLPTWIPIIATLGLILSAAYYVWTIQRMFFGKLFVYGNRTITDITTLEWLVLLPLGILILFLGIYPQPLIDIINPFALQLSELFQSVAIAKP